MGKASISAITSTDILTVGQGALKNKRQKLEIKSMRADDQSLNRKENNINLSMQHTKCEDLNCKSSRDATDGYVDVDRNNHVPSPSDV